MPKLQVIQTNFTAGEVSPKLMGRVDLQRYQNGAERIENAISQVYGGVERRRGSRFIAESRARGKRVRLISYVVTRTLAFVLEFGDRYVRVFNGTGSYAGIELVTPYSEAMLDEIDYVQGSDEMLLAHPDVPIHRLRRFDDGTWNIDPAPFTTTPFDEIGYSPAIYLTLDNPTVGAGRHGTATANAFVAADVGRAIVVGSGIGVITSVDSSTVVTIQINSAFLGTVFNPGEWTIDSSPMSELTPNATGPVGTLIHVTFDIPTMHGGENGQYINVNGGLLKITNTSSPTTLDAEVIVELSSVAAAQALAWSLNSSVWSAHSGYPRTLTLYEQRLIAGGTKKYPQTIWGSRSGEVFDFTSGTLDDDSFSFTIAADEVNPITFLCAARVLIALTDGGEFTIQGGVEKPITPTTIQIKPQSPFGSLGVRPVNVGKEIMFVQRSGRKIRALSYQYTSDGYVAPDITVLAEHITETGIVDLAYQQEPFQILWAVRADGLLVSCTIDRDQDVIAWNRHPASGFVERISSIPGENGDDLWLVVRRTVAGIERRYIERLEQSWLPTMTSAKDWGYTLDSAVEFTALSPLDTFTGLDHLEGETVGILADSSVMSPRVVTGGSVTIERVASRVLVGLPFTTRVRMLRPEVPSGGGTSQLAAKRTSRVRLRFNETVGAKFNGEVVPFRNFGPDILDAPIAPFSGDRDVTNDQGWDEDGTRLEITQEDPAPFHLLGVMRELTLNAG